jgi:hypothetical protein
MEVTVLAQTLLQAGVEVRLYGIKANQETAGKIPVSPSPVLPKGEVQPVKDMEVGEDLEQVVMDYYQAQEEEMEETELLDLLELFFCNRGEKINQFVFRFSFTYSSHMG